MSSSSTTKSMTCDEKTRKKKNTKEESKALSLSVLAFHLHFLFFFPGTGGWIPSFLLLSWLSRWSFCDSRSAVIISLHILNIIHKWHLDFIYSHNQVSTSLDCISFFYLALGLQARTIKHFILPSICTTFCLDFVSSNTQIFPLNSRVNNFFSAWKKFRLQLTVAPLAGPYHAF